MFARPHFHGSERVVRPKNPDFLSVQVCVPPGIIAIQENQVARPFRFHFADDTGSLVLH